MTPLHSELSVPSQIALEAIGYSRARSLQHEAIIAIRSNHDVLFQSRAGTGKSTTIGILIAEECYGKGMTIVCVPNETLLKQAHIELTRMLSYSSVVVLGLNGDQTMYNSGASRHLVVIGTPNQFLSSEYPLRNRSCTYLIFDEADELFAVELYMTSSAILRLWLKPETKTVFFSATFPPFIKSRIEEALVAADPSRQEPPCHVELCVSTSTEKDLNAVVPHVSHFFSVVDHDNEISKLLVQLILREREAGGRRCIVFGGSENLISEVSHAFSVTGVSVNLIQTPLDSVSAGDVILDPNGYLSRGVNIQDLDFGISLNVPEEKELLMHQWGRIGREGQQGKFIHIIHRDDIAQLDYLSFQLGVTFREIQLARDGRHPFEIHHSTEDRFAAVLDLIRSVHS